MLEYMPNPSFQRQRKRSVRLRLGTRGRGGDDQRGGSAFSSIAPRLSSWFFMVRMKKAATNPAERKTLGTRTVEKHRTGMNQLSDAGRVAVRRAKSATQNGRAPAPHGTIAYDAEDIEEANRIGVAVCRQHAR